jgi:hypothetical protein
MHPSYYYFGTSDSDSTDDSYDLTCECFHIDGAIASDSEVEAVVEGRNATPSHIDLSDAQDGALFLGAAQGAQLEQIQELQAKLDEERENLCLLQQTLEQERAARARGGGARERAHDVNRHIIKDRAGEPPIFNRASKSSSPPPCFSAICLSHLPPRPIELVMKFEVSSRLRLYSRPKVLPRGAARLHQSSLRSPPDRRKRPQFILNPCHKVTRQPLSMNASSIIANPEMPIMTSTSVVGIKAMIVHPEATTCTGEGDMTAQRIAAHLLSRRALESSAKPSAGPSF